MSGVSDIVGGIGGVFNAFGGAPEFDVLKKTKWGGLQSAIEGGLTTYNKLKASGDDALSAFISKYLSGQKAAESQTGQEVNAIGQFYNGQMATQLGALRAAREKAVNDAANVAVQQAQRGMNLSRLGDQGGGGSYWSRLALGTLEPIRVQAALDNSNQARSDLGYLTGNQIGLAGQRTALQDALANRQLVPNNIGRQMFGQNLGYLGALNALDLNNNFYGLQKQPTLGDRLIAFGQAGSQIDSGLMSIAGMAGGMGGMGGGGGGMGGLGGLMGGGGGGASGGGAAANPLYSTTWGGGGSSYNPGANMYGGAGTFGAGMGGTFTGTGGYGGGYSGMGAPISSPGLGYGNFGTQSPSGFGSPITAGGGVSPGAWNFGNYGMSRGGMVHGMGTSHSDLVTIHASPGEYVMPASAVRLPGALPILERMRAHGLASEVHPDRYFN